MSPEIWGEYAWKFLHIVTLAYPENPTLEDKIRYYQFFQSLQYVLPCAKCRYNMSQHFKRYPLTEEALSSRANLMKWLIDIHNVVNYYTGKQMLSYPDAVQQIQNWANPSKCHNQLFYYILIAIIIVIVIYFAYYYKKLNKKSV